MGQIVKSFICLVTLAFFSNTLFAQVDKNGRIGLGMSNQLVTGTPALSFKIQKSRSFSFGGLLAMDMDDQSGGYGAGLKAYKNIYEEPQLNFYSSFLIAMLSEKTLGVEDSGFQADLTLGSEFHFPGLESLGFSFEFGFSVNSLGENTALKTAGYHIITAGVHFYL